MQVVPSVFFSGTNNLLVCATRVVLDRLWVSGVVYVHREIQSGPVCTSHLKMEPSGAY